MNIILARAIGAAASLVVAFAFGVMYEHGKFQEYKGEVKGASGVQEQATKAADTKNEGDAHAAQQSYAEAIKSLDAYYRAHPVIRVQHDGSCFMPEAAGSAKSPNAAPTGLYASPYPPADTELIAERLDALQRRLLDAGVTVR